MLLAIYDDALASVYGYLRRRVATDAIAEDLASERFLDAVTSVRTGMAKEVGVAWLIGIARHKLLDHYRRTGREQRNLRVVALMTPVPEVATTLGRSVHATEALLSRARVAFRSNYETHAERWRTDGN